MWACGVYLLERTPKTHLPDISKGIKSWNESHVSFPGDSPLKSATDFVNFVTVNDSLAQYASRRHLSRAGGNYLCTQYRPRQDTAFLPHSELPGFQHWQLKRAQQKVRTGRELRDWVESYPGTRADGAWERHWKPHCWVVFNHQVEQPTVCVDWWIESYLRYMELLFVEIYLPLSLCVLRLSRWSPHPSRILRWW